MKTVICITVMTFYNYTTHTHSYICKLYKKRRWFLLGNGRISLQPRMSERYYCTIAKHSARGLNIARLSVVRALQELKTAQSQRQIRFFASAAKKYLTT